MTFNFQPLLVGTRLSLRPMRADDHDRLFAVASDPLIWAQHPDPSRAETAGFDRFFAESLVSGGALVATDNASGKVIGASRYYDYDVAAKELAIGYTFLARSHWGGVFNAEMKRLMIEHARKDVAVIWFHVARSNLRSRRAMEKIGAQMAYEGERPQHGQMLPFLYYRIDAQSWTAS
jgi:RimJ/RimL family protein N-acetyltransferase